VRQNAEEITVFKSVGLGLEDVAVAAWVYESLCGSGGGRGLENV
jgi:ornithine cyclodeaminase/alanine dehydrogenase-like protein (mu-crystallin family)